MPLYQCVTAAGCLEPGVTASVINGTIRAGRDRARRAEPLTKLGFARHQQQLGERLSPTDSTKPGRTEP